jgi:hypothetical protein
MTKPLMALVTWLDPSSTASGEVHHIDDLTAAHGPVTVTTMGWVLKDDDKGMSVACESLGGGSYRGFTFILKALIVSVRYLSEKRVKKPAAEPTV